MILPKKYIFSWNDIPGQGGLNLRNLLVYGFGQDWVKNAIISKSSDDIVYVENSPDEIIVTHDRIHHVFNIHSNEGWTLTLDSDGYELKGEQKNRDIYIGDQKWVKDLVKKASKKAGIPTPRVVITRNDEPNSFVFGTSRTDAVLVLHTGLIKLLNKRELESVIIHELSHIKNGDCIVLTITTAIPLIIHGAAESSKELALRPLSLLSVFKTVIYMTISLVFYLFYYISRLFLLTLSRYREYYADITTMRLIQNPSSLISALSKITYGLAVIEKKKNDGMRCFYIADPVMALSDAKRIDLKEFDIDADGFLNETELLAAMEKEASDKWRFLDEFFSTHPPVFKRILLLKELERELEGSVTVK